MKKALLILSGGLDSATLGYYLKANGYNELLCVTYDYAQKHKIEIEYAKKIVKHLKATHKIIDISFMKQIIHGSSLLDDLVKTPYGKYDDQNMQITVVPNRNTILLSIAWAIACVENIDVVAYGAQAGDHFVYPDTREDYCTAMNLALRLGTEKSRKDNLELIAPFIRKTKAEVIKLGLTLGVAFQDTWSCYESFELHCGKCGACNNRKQGFLENNITDPTIYLNS